jgi:2-oxoglutarate ferredoxin oxidoreductase subunit beta
MVLSVSELKTEVHNDWCPGCGDFGILNAIQIALSEMDIEKHKVAIFSGIGCSGKTPHFINTYGIHTLHGRVLPFAQGAKLANNDLEVIAVGGDGDGLGIGAGHFVSAGRRNVNMVYIIFNNAVYGLTKGQAAPTLQLGMKTKSLPQPNVNSSLNPISLSLIAGFTFIARGYAYDIRHLKEILKMAINHKGLSFVDILQPCPTYNDINTKEWFQGLDRVSEENEKALPRIYKLESTGYDGIVRDPLESEEKYIKAIRKAQEWGDRIPIGIFYQNEFVSTFQDRISTRVDKFLENPPAKQEIADLGGNPISSIDKLLDSMKIS